MRGICVGAAPGATVKLPMGTVLVGALVGDTDEGISVLGASVGLELGALDGMVVGATEDGASVLGACVGAVMGAAVGKLDVGDAVDGGRVASAYCMLVVQL